MKPETVKLREAILGYLEDTLTLPEFTGLVLNQKIRGGWLTTNQISILLGSHQQPAEYTKVYPNLAALARQGEVSHWPAHRLNPLLSGSDQIMEGVCNEARWRFRPILAPTHDVVALEQWLAKS